MPCGEGHAAVSGGAVLKKQLTNLPASVRQRLLNLARQRAEEFELVLTRFALERFLYRLSVSSHADRFVLKGAMLFAVWVPDSFRATRDLDLLGRGDTSPAALEAVFREICRVPVTPDGLEFPENTVRLEPIRESQRYLGARAKLEARIAGAMVGLQVDVGFGDAVVPPPTEIEYPTLLDFARPRIRAYSRYSVAAEKLQAMVDLGLTNSRLKDFFDLFTLASRFEFAGQDLVTAIRATFGRRSMAIPAERPVALTPLFSGDPGKRAQWQGFLKRARVPGQVPSLEGVIKVIAAFVEEPLAAAHRDAAFTRRWTLGGPWSEL